MKSPLPPTGESLNRGERREPVENMGIWIFLHLKNENKMKYYGLGRRKSAVAQVYISSFDNRSTKTAEKEVQRTQVEDREEGGGSIHEISLDAHIIINKKNFLDYFQNDQNFIQSIQHILKIFDQPLQMRVTVSGGGSTGQKDAILLALARALCPCHPIFKKKNLLTQDARRKERKKYGLKKARKAPQYSKR